MLSVPPTGRCIMPTVCLGRRSAATETCFVPCLPVSRVARRPLRSLRHCRVAGAHLDPSQWCRDSVADRPGWLLATCRHCRKLIGFGPVEKVRGKNQWLTRCWSMSYSHHHSSLSRTCCCGRTLEVAASAVCSDQPHLGAIGRLAGGQWGEAFVGKLGGALPRSDRGLSSAILSRRRKCCRREDRTSRRLL